MIRRTNPNPGQKKKGKHTYTHKQSSDGKQGVSDTYCLKHLVAILSGCVPTVLCDCVPAVLCDCMPTVFDCVPAVLSDCIV